MLFNSLMSIRSLTLLRKSKSVLVFYYPFRKSSLHNVIFFQNEYCSISGSTHLFEGQAKNVFLSYPKANLYGLEEHSENSLNRRLNVDTLNSDSSMCLKERRSDEINSEIIGQFKFIKNQDGDVVVYIDGACLNNGKTNAKAGLGVWFNHEHPLNVSAPVKGRATNNNAEIQAAKVAVFQAHRAGLLRLCIYTDSKFVISCMTEWIHRWKENGWKLASGHPVKNKEELLELEAEMATMEFVNWQYVAGHKGVDGNRMADKLARQGATHYNPDFCQT